MRVQRFDVQIAAGPRGHALIVVPFDPDREWGVKAVHHVSGTVQRLPGAGDSRAGQQRLGVNDEPGENAACVYRGRLAGARGTVAEGPQRGDLAGDIAAALDANPAAGAFFDTLARFYRNGYLRYIDATKRRPDLRAARIAEVTGLLARGIKERPCS